MQSDVPKPSGWTGKKSDPWWFKNTRHGVVSKCSTCGCQVRGYGNDRDRSHHYDSCSRVQGERKEWEAWVSKDGEVKVYRHSVEKVMGHVSREDALRALDVSLRQQMEAIEAHRATVARLLESA